MHFDCFASHRFFYKASLNYKPLEPSFIPTTLESKLWDLSPHWSDALAQPPVIPDERETIRLVWPPHTESETLVGRPGTRRIVRVITVIDIGYATSDLVVDQHSFREFCGKQSWQSGHRIVVPEHLQRPFSEEELKWINQFDLETQRVPVSDLPTRPIDHSLPSSPATSLKSLTSLLFRTLRPDLHLETPVDRFATASCYDRNVWREILGFSVHPTLRPGATLQFIATDREMHSSSTFIVSAHEEFRASVDMVNDGWEIVVFRHDRQTHSFIVRPPAIQNDMQVSINAHFLALSFGSSCLNIVTHAGDYVMHFQLPSSVTMYNRLMVLHPSLPFVAYASFDAVDCFTFSGQRCFSRRDPSTWTGAVMARFDAVHELLVVQLATSKFKIFPLNGEVPFTVSLSEDSLPGPVVGHFIDEMSELTRVAWAWPSIAPISRKRKY